MPYECAHRASHQTFALRGAEVGKWRYLLVPIDETKGNIPPLAEIQTETLPVDRGEIEYSTAAEGAGVVARTFALCAFM
ncbi:hypothetical protein MESS4_630019 [Mesorhizobium sp. STM 4661]|nr:hypothetical protein MESS4_630019 [Mesorhizobium sp. STM 4661]